MRDENLALSFLNILLFYKKKIMQFKHLTMRKVSSLSPLSSFFQGVRIIHT